MLGTREGAFVKGKLQRKKFGDASLKGISPKQGEREDLRINIENSVLGAGQEGGFSRFEMEYAALGGSHRADNNN